MARRAGVQLCASSDDDSGPPTEPMKSIDPRREREDAALGVTALELAFRGTRFPATYPEEFAAWSEYMPPADWVPAKRQTCTTMRVLGSRLWDRAFRGGAAEDMREPGHYTSQLGALGIRRLGEQYAFYFPDVLRGEAWGDRDELAGSRRDGLCVLSIDRAAGKVTFG